MIGNLPKDIPVERKTKIILTYITKIARAPKALYLIEIDIICLTCQSLQECKKYQQWNGSSRSIVDLKEEPSVVL